MTQDRTQSFVKCSELLVQWKDLPCRRWESGCTDGPEGCVFHL